jgi:hypothetical protein
MSRLFIKFKFFFYFYKSKFLKKKIYEDKSKLDLFKKLAEKYKFKKIWFFNNFQIFEYFLPKNLNKKFRYLEVGSCEGLSLFYILTKYKKVNVVAIDVINIINKKIKNLKNFQFIKSDSIIALRKLVKKNKKFNYIYIDGLHHGEHVIVDAIESFKILQHNGIMIFDDFMSIDKNLTHQTFKGLLYFLNFFKKEIRILYLQNVLVIRKIRN